MIHDKEHVMQRLLLAYMERWDHLYYTEFTDKLADLGQNNPSEALKIMFPEEKQ